MFARTVRMQLKPNSVREFTRLVEEEGSPGLRTVSNSTWRGIRILPPSFGVAMHRCLGGR
jgi:hypothetical protein